MLELSFLLIITRGADNDAGESVRGTGQSLRHNGTRFKDLLQVGRCEEGTLRLQLRYSIDGLI